MSWITIIWSMNAAACLTLAGIYLIVWLKSGSTWGHLLFSFCALAAAATAACELLVMRAETVEQYGEAMWRANGTCAAMVSTPSAASNRLMVS